MQKLTEPVSISKKAKEIQKNFEVIEQFILRKWASLLKSMIRINSTIETEEFKHALFFLLNWCVCA